ncbi:MAG: diaminopimelate decarboxylase [Clostridia bacterium]|nr:diaminopimelate decarboxylase [Clostridia bacterium]
MFRHDNLTVNDRNHLVIGGCDCVDLAAQYGTPLYVMDEDVIRSNARAYKNAIDKYYGGNGMALYASKALSVMYMYKIVAEEGLGVDVVSGGELYTALKAGFNPENIYFHGNNKTTDELNFALDEGVGRIVVDNYDELSELNTLCISKGKVAKILFRIKPGIDAHTHEFISTGQIDSKFGVTLENGEALDIIKTASQMEGVEVVGVHCHIGSQIFELAPFEEAARVMLGFVAEVKSKLGIEISELNLGGGFGIRYVEGDAPIAYDSYIEAVSRVVKSICEEKGLKLPRILMEPGRSIVGDAGITLYTIGMVKDIPGVRKYVSVDGGMADNPRYIMYDAEYDGVLANRAGDRPEETVTLCGRCCESGDILIKNAHLPSAKKGDIMCIMSTGAYNYSMASNYNRIPRPALVMVSGGKSKLAVKRETYEDIVRNDII